MKRLLGVSREIWRIDCLILGYLNPSYGLGGDPPLEGMFSQVLCHSHQACRLSVYSMWGFPEIRAHQIIQNWQFHLVLGFPMSRQPPYHVTGDVIRYEKMDCIAAYICLHLHLHDLCIGVDFWPGGKSRWVICDMGRHWRSVHPGIQKRVSWAPLMSSTAKEEPMGEKSKVFYCPAYFGVETVI